MSKWPRIQWNQANAKLSNKPFIDLFKEPVPVPLLDEYRCLCLNCTTITTYHRREMVDGRTRYACERCGAERWESAEGVTR